MRMSVQVLGGLSSNVIYITFTFNPFVDRKYFYRLCTEVVIDDVPPTNIADIEPKWKRILSSPLLPRNCLRYTLETDTDPCQDCSDCYCDLNNDFSI